MTSTRPYLIRAFYDWIIDNHCTPHIVVNAGFENVRVPQEFVNDGQIVLNISMTAVQGLVLGETAIEFKARFGGRIQTIYAPVNSILAIYARENGRGMVFAEEETLEHPEDESLESEDSENITGATSGNAVSQKGSGPATSISSRTKGNGTLSIVPSPSASSPSVSSPVSSATSPASPSLTLQPRAESPTQKNDSKGIGLQNGKLKKDQNEKGDDKEGGGNGKGKGKGRGHLTLIK